METIFSKLRKIAALAERGVGGEKVNARAQLAKLLKRYDLTVFDLAQSEKDAETDDYPFTYATKAEYELLVQCCCCVLRVSEISIHKEPRRRRVWIGLTRLDRAEVSHMYEHYRKLWRKASGQLFDAFIVKYRIMNPDTKYDGGGRKLSKAETEAIIALMSGLGESGYVSTRRQLGKGGVT